MQRGTLMKYSKQIAVDYFIVNNMITILTAHRTYAMDLTNGSIHYQRYSDCDIFTDESQQIALRVESDTPASVAGEWIEVPFQPYGINLYY